LHQWLRDDTWSVEQYQRASRIVREWSATTYYSRAVEWSYRDWLDAFQTTKIDMAYIERLGQLSRGFPPSARWLWIPGERTRTQRVVTAAFRQSRSALDGRRRPDWGAFLSNYERNTPWAMWLLMQIRDESLYAFRVSLEIERQVLNVDLALRAHHAEQGHWPESLEAIPLPIGDEDAKRLYYLPKGLWGGQAPEPLQARGWDGKALELTGNEACLVVGLPIGHTNLPDDLINASPVHREQILQELLVIPLEKSPKK
jgi:hypothetical protein